MCVEQKQSEGFVWVLNEDDGVRTAHLGSWENPNRFTVLHRRVAINAACTPLLMDTGTSKPQELPPSSCRVPTTAPAHPHPLQRPCLPQVPVYESSLSWFTTWCAYAGFGVLGFCEARTPITRKRGRLRGRDPARWKEGAILRFPIGRARPRPQQIENPAAADARLREFSIFCWGILRRRDIRIRARDNLRGVSTYSTGKKKRSHERHCCLTDACPQLLNWSIGHLPPLAPARALIRVRDNPRGGAAAPPGAEGRF